MKLKMKTWYRSFSGANVYVCSKHLNGKFIGQTKNGVLMYSANGKVDGADKDIPHDDDLLEIAEGDPSFDSQTVYKYVDEAGDVWESTVKPVKSKILSKVEYNVRN